MNTSVNWKEQWAHHAFDFREGLAHIPLPNGEEIKLLPGPGFGDFSHPTTQMMITLMASHCKGKVVFDIGCGSGILALAALKMGASKAYICDIDPDAVAHAKENGIQNGFTLEVGPPKEENVVVLMNMIHLEQIQAWEANRCSFACLITSGVLTSERSLYLSWASDALLCVDQTPVEELAYQGWCAFKSSNSMS